jgi:8-amino-7-oxononanoate synthase
MDAEKELASLEERGLLRRLLTHPPTVLSFSSNDYLDLARDPRLEAAACEAVRRLGCGATASRLMAGNLEEHEALEADLARLVGHEAALLFGSGFLTNLGVLTALAGRGTHVFADRLNHASLVDGMLLSRATCHRYRHRDMAHLDALLKQTDGPRLIVSDSVFSMDGDIAPVEALTALAERHGALLVVDEAHAIGVFGKGGGVCRERGVLPDVAIGTLSKALGGYGGFAACSKAVRALLINRARSFIYSTGLPPACLGSGTAAVSIVEETPELGAELLRRAGRFRHRLADRGLRLGPTESQIVPVIIGPNEAAVAASQRLRARGIVATAVRPPTVPAGTARLRLSVTLAHSEADLDAVADAVAECVP